MIRVAFEVPKEIDSPWDCDGVANCTGVPLMAVMTSRLVTLYIAAVLYWRTTRRLPSAEKLAPVAPGTTTVPILIRVFSELMLGLVGAAYTAPPAALEMM